MAITGQVPSAAIGTDAFQEADIRGITMPITKHNYLITNPDEIPQAINEAFHLAASGRPGPVLVDISKDALQAETEFSWPTEIDLPGYHPTTRPHSKQIREAARAILSARQPVLYVGGGVIRGGATAALYQLAELTGIPVVTTLMARGAFPDSHPQNLGMPGMHGTVAAVGALQQSDLLITLGARFDDRVTGKLSTFAPKASVIHADIDPAEIGKNRTADIPIVGDVAEIIPELITAIEAELAEGSHPDYGDWWNQLNRLRETYPLGYDLPEDGSLSPQYVIERLGALSGAGQHLRGGRGAAPDVGRTVRRVRAAGHLAQFRRARHDGLRRPRGHGSQGRTPRHDGVGGGRRRMLPDDQPGVGHVLHQRHTDQGRTHQQFQPRNGAPVADVVL